MATDWTAERLGVYQDIADEGFDVTVRVPGSEGTWSDTTMSYSSPTDDTDYTTYGIRQEYTSKEIDGTVVQQGDSKLIIPALGLNSSGTLVVLPTLTASHKILISSVEQNVVNVSRLAPGNVTLINTLQVRE